MAQTDQLNCFIRLASEDEINVRKQTTYEEHENQQNKGHLEDDKIFGHLSFPEEL